jgi:hypothetical protein
VAGSLEETRDLHLDGDFLPEMPEVTGRTALVQRLIRRLTTQPGVLPCWQNQGINVPSLVLSKVPLWRIRAAIETECGRDEQVGAGNARARLAQNGSGLRIDVFIRSAEGPFTFTMGVTEAAATLIALQEAA